jgi:hypothetical protein
MKKVFFNYYIIITDRHWLYTEGQLTRNEKNQKHNEKLYYLA